MNQSVRWTALITFVVLASSCASPKQAGPRMDAGASRNAVGVNQPSVLLRQAREIEGRGGCVIAVPIYRIVASHGAGYEVAQFELGSCLLEVEGATQEETALFRQEGLFWLDRAAWAGNPRAQIKLAEVLSGTPHYSILGIEAAPAQGLFWSAVYDANGVRDTYGLSATPKLVSEHLQQSVSGDDWNAAVSAATKFRPIIMAEFVPTAREGASGRARDDAQRPSGGGGRRRPRQ